MIPRTSYGAVLPEREEPPKTWAAKILALVTLARRPRKWRTAVFRNKFPFIRGLC
jgi:hypothetical protein